MHPSLVLQLRAVVKGHRMLVQMGVSYKLRTKIHGGGGRVMMVVIVPFSYSPLGFGAYAVFVFLNQRVFTVQSLSINYRFILKG